SASSILMFAAFIGIPMFASEFLELKWILLLVVAMGLAGLGLFLVRQKVQQDDGFLAVTLHAFGSIVSGRNASARTESATAPENDIRRHWLFADAARKFGPETAEGPLAVFRIVSVFLLVSVFWALFDQHMTSWIRQAEQMNLTVNLLFTKITLLPSQIQSLNPLLVMILLPVINLFVYPAMARLGFNPTPLRKMTVGMAVASLAFVAVATIQHTINAAEPGSVSVLWQIIPYVIMTSAEVMVSVTGLEFAYTQAPKPMKSTIMGFWLLAVSLGNLLVAFLTRFEGLPLVDFFWVFAGLMAVAAGLFAVFSLFYRYREYQQ
ncbi:MAG: hypothetical protein KDA85_08115, partial [Planctomycetaceae bacterium]|nr:hypothetical protein [Planctomycetaceae bacterium]